VTTSKRHDLNEWQLEPSVLRSTAERDALRQALSTTHMVERVEDNPALWQEIVARPDDDDPRHAYAAWFRDQPQNMAQRFADFMEAQLRVAAAFRADPRADVAALRSWPDIAYVSVPDFRAAAPLRRWLMEPLRLLLADGLVGWPQFYRGAVERVAMRARRLLDVGDEVFRVAPIRHLVLTEVPEVASQLARSPLLARIRSLSLPAYQARDVITDEHLATLLGSPHLDALAHMRLVHQRALTERSYEQIATARTLPRLSCLEVFVSAQWNDQVQERYAPIGRRERQFTRDTTRNVRRARYWIADVERRIGHQPCFHPETYYRPDYLDLENVIEHPIACDPRVMSHRGRHLATPSIGADATP
jgi:uncharacterized protein (TIGR02996 family)